MNAREGSAFEGLTFREAGSVLSAEIVSPPPGSERQISSVSFTEFQCVCRKGEMESFKIRLT
jgi:hypothetical protein